MHFLMMNYCSRNFPVIIVYLWQYNYNGSRQWELFISVKPFKFLVSPTTHVCKLEARANRKFHADKSFGGVGYFNVLS